MLDTNRIPSHVLKDIMAAIDGTESDVRRLSSEEAFGFYCQWNGLLGWGNKLWDAVAALKEADLQPGDMPNDYEPPLF